MSQYQPIEENYAEEYPENYGTQQKRKRVSQGYTSPDVDKQAWSAIGAVGVILTIGCIIVGADSNGAEWVMALPIAYMMAMIKFMRQS